MKFNKNTPEEKVPENAKHIFVPEFESSYLYIKMRKCENIYGI
jgi:hypothetical protein